MTTTATITQLAAAPDVTTLQPVGTTAMNENMKKYEALVKTLQETIQYNGPAKESDDILTHTQCMEKLVAALLDQGIDALNKSKGVVDMLKLLKPSVKASGSKHNKWTYVIPQGFGDDPKTHEGAPTLANNLVVWLRNGLGEKHGFSAADYWQDKKMDLLELIGAKQKTVTKTKKMEIIQLLKATRPRPDTKKALISNQEAFDKLKQYIYTLQPDFQFSWEKEEEDSSEEEDSDTEEMALKRKRVD
jgi:hypothetical protein